MSIVILTGAGISAESGIKTFRDANGLWENHRIEDVASPEGFERNAALVHEFYNQRRRQLLSAKVVPNAGHLALAELEKKYSGDFLLVTQNVDNLHERAGNQSMLHMHGELLAVFCLFCSSKWRTEEDTSVESQCRRCQKKGGVRPDIVWFGEMPYFMDQIYEALEACRIFIAIGTSGQVYPAAGFVQVAKAARKIEINLADTASAQFFDEQYIGPASLKVPELVKNLLHLTKVQS